jgi:hypothetical protein
MKITLGALERLKQTSTSAHMLLYAVKEVGVVKNA